MKLVNEITTELTTQGIEIILSAPQDKESTERVYALLGILIFVLILIIWGIIYEVGGEREIFIEIFPQLVLMLVGFIFIGVYGILRVISLFEKERIQILQDHFIIGKGIWNIADTTAYLIDHIHQLRQVPQDKRKQGTLCFDYHAPYTISHHISINQTSPSRWHRMKATFLLVLYFLTTDTRRLYEGFRRQPPKESLPLSTIVVFGKSLTIEATTALLITLSEIFTLRYHLIEDIVFSDSLLPDLPTMRQNPDGSTLTVPFFRVKRIHIDTETYNFHHIERFLTYAINTIGQDYLKQIVEVYLYGQPEKLHQNLRNSLDNLCKLVTICPDKKILFNTPVP